MSGHTERDFEMAIEAGLTSTGGYETRSPSAHDEALALFPDDITGFMKESQPAKWQALEALLGPKTVATVLDGLSKELELKGTLHVLRHGFVSRMPILSTVVPRTHRKREMTCDLRTSPRCSKPAPINARPRRAC